MKVGGKSFHSRDSKAIHFLLQPTSTVKRVDLVNGCKYNDPMILDRLKPRESLGFLSWKVSRLMTSDLAARFAEAGVGVTVEQWRALIPMFKLDGLSQGRLCEILSQEKTGVSRLVAALERRGLVHREASKQDRRIKHIYITESGRELIESTLNMVTSIRGERIKSIDPVELAICKKVLWEIIVPTLDDDCLTKESTNSLE